MARLGDLVGSAEKEFVTVPGSHIGMIAGPDAREGTWPRVADWLQAHSG